MDYIFDLAGGISSKIGTQVTWWLTAFVFLNLYVCLENVCS